MAASENVARHLGMFNDKLTLAGERENPLQLLIRELQGSALRPVS
jgi:phage terminase small subunit